MRMKNVRWLWLAVVMSLLLTSFSACAGQGNASLTDRQIVEAKLGTLTISVDADGNLALPVQQKLTFETTGTIKEIRVKKGERVSPGQLLAALDDSTQQDVVKQQQLNLKQQEEALTVAQLELQRAREQLEESAPKTPVLYTYYTDIPAVQTNITSARTSIEEALALYAAGKATEGRAELDRARGFLDAAYTATGNSQFVGIDRTRPVSDAISNLRQLTFQQDRAESSLNRAQTAVEAARLSLAQARKEVDKTKLVAPIGGIVVDLPAKTGDRLTQANYGSVTVLQLVDPSAIEMEGLVDEIDIPRVKMGQEARILIDALPDAQVRGKVTYISTVATIKSGVVSYKVTLALEAPAGVELRDGMTATARIGVERVADGLLVAELAIKDRDSRAWVEVVGPNGASEKRLVTLGKTDGRTTEILSGLKQGERVYVEAARSMVTRPIS